MSPIKIYKFLQSLPKEKRGGTFCPPLFIIKDCFIILELELLSLLEQELQE
jgi:hypothetical protein